MGSSRFGLCGRVVLIVLSSFLLALTVHAKEGFYIGGGVASQSVSGGLDGKHLFTDSSGTVAIAAGKPGSGSGFAIDGGYAFTPRFAIDVLLASTSHTATFQGAGFDSDMTLTTTMFGVRGALPLNDNLDLVGRIGFASATATYAKFASSPSGFGEAKFTGSGVGFGAGIEYAVEKVAFSANYSMLNITFDEAEGGGVSGKLPNTLSSTISQVALLVTYYFK